MMTFVATFRGYPTVNPISAKSLAVLTCLIAVTILIGRRSWFSRTVRIQIARAASLVISIVFIVLLMDHEPASSYGFWLNYPGPPQADDFASAYLLLAFGFGFALHGLRAPWTVLRVVAIATSTFLGAVITKEAMGKLAWGHWDLDLEFWVSVAPYSFIFLWVPRLIILVDRYDRPARGECVRCGYDLRHASTDQCPECGATKLQSEE